MLGELVRGHRRRLGLTQDELAEKAGLSARNIRDIEAGRIRHPRASTVRLLADTLGLSDPEREAFRRIADADSAEAGAALEPAPAAMAPVPAARCLPRPAMHFGGRDEHLDHLAAVVAGHPPGGPLVVAVDGMAGVGKTALALQLAHIVADRYPDGQLFVDLHGHSQHAPVEPSVAVGLLLGQLGVPAHELPDALEGRVARWRTELADRRVLVVLDNAADSDQLRPLLPGLSSTLVLVTGRRRLVGLDSDAQCSLEPLDDAAAVALLARVIGERRIAERAEHASEAARLCGNLPLALRLAAARLVHRPTWTVADLVDRLRAAQPPPVELSAEGMSVGAALTLSYRQLTEPAQRLLRMLGLHPGEDFDEYAAAALAGLYRVDVRPALDELLDAHLVQEPTGGRYRLHDLIRDYAARLAATVDDEGARRAAGLRLAEYYLHTVVINGQDEPRVNGFFEPDWGAPSPHRRTFESAAELEDWEEAEWRNLLAVTELADRLGLDRQVCLLARAVWGYHWRRGNAGILTRLHHRALRAAQRLADPALTAMAHNYLAGAGFRAGRMRTARAHLSAARQLWQATGDEAAALIGTLNLLTLETRVGRFSVAVEQGRLALERHRHLPPDLRHRMDDNQAAIHRVIGSCLAMFGDYAGALHHVRRAAGHLIRGGGHSYGIGTVLLDLGHVHARLGHRIVAPLLLRRALAINERLGNEVAAAEALCELGIIHARDGRLDEARRLHETAVRRMRRADQPHCLCLTLNRLAGTLSAGNDVARAAATHREALAIAERTDYRYEEAVAHAGLAACLRDSEPATAEHHRARAEELYAEMGVVDPYHVAEGDPAATGDSPVSRR